MRQILRWLRTGPEPKRDRDLEQINDALLADARRIREISPDTTGQWNRLQSSLRDSAYAENQQRARPSKAVFTIRALVKPAFALGLAGVALFVAISVLWPSRDYESTFETTRGQQSSMLLADSSEVTLNHTSKLVVESLAARNVRLTGEAFFHVRKTGAPFTVSTDIGVVQVLGTEFNVWVRDGRLVVGVVHGSVRVTARRNGIDSAVVLTAGEITSCQKGGYPSGPALLPFTDYPGWTHNKLMFYRATIQSACEEIASKFDADVRVASGKVSVADTGTTFTGSIEAKTLDSSLRILSALTDKKIKNEDGHYFLY